MKKRFRPLTLWAINGRLDRFRLKEQLDEMKECGFEGTIFHPRYNPDEPAFMSHEYLDILSDTILHAKKLGLEFWIYDENGWPSGSGNGKVYEHFPDRTCDWLIYRDGKVTRESRNNFNTFDREEMAYFIQTVYDGYRIGLSREAFEYVTGFFSDEVGFLDGHGATLDRGGVPWCPEASERRGNNLFSDSLQRFLLYQSFSGKLSRSRRAGTISGKSLLSQDRLISEQTVWRWAMSGRSPGRKRVGPEAGRCGKLCRLAR